MNSERMTRNQSRIIEEEAAAGASPLEHLLAVDAGFLDAVQLLKGKGITTAQQVVDGEAAAIPELTHEYLTLDLLRSECGALTSGPDAWR